MYGTILFVYECIKIKCYFFHLLLLLSTVALTLTDLTCKDQGDCNDEDFIKCGICVDSETPGVGKCIFPFPLKYKDGKKCTEVTDCEENCNGHGYCTTEKKDENRIAIYPSCVCNVGFHGSTCQHSTPKDLIGIFYQHVDLQFRATQKPNETLHLGAYFTCVNKLSEFEKESQSGDKGLLTISVKLPWYACKHFGDPFYLISNLRYPYLSINRYAINKTLVLGNKVLGYLSYFGFKWSLNGVVNIERKVPIFISYQKDDNLICVPVIRLSGCSKKWQKKVLFSKFKRIKITSSVSYLADGRYVSTSVHRPECEENSNYQWHIWRDGITTKEDSSPSPLLRYYNVKELSFEPYILGFGDYKVLLEVSVVQEKPAQNFRLCYFTIKFMPFLAVIYGGSERSITKHLGLTLNSASSLDPNMPLNKQGHMKAYWSCVDVLNPKHEICEPSLPYPISSNYFVPPDQLSYGTVYNITLMIWTNYYDGCKRCGLVKPAYAFATISVTNKTTVTGDNIYILCLLNCKEKVLHTQQLYLRVKSNSSQATTTTHGPYRWTYYEKGQAEHDIKSISVEGLPDFMLIVKENALTSGKIYTIVVRTLNMELFAKYSFETQQIEFEGNCSIDPNTGIKGLTLFTITCEQFSISSIFEFYDKSQDEANAGLIFNGRMLGTSDLSETAELKDFRVTRGNVFVYIIDSSGLYTHKKFEVALSPWEVSTEELEDIFQNVTEMINQGDTADALEYISSVPDIIPLEIDKDYILDKLLCFITLVPSDSLANIKLTTSTMTNVLLSLNKQVQLAVKPKLMKETIDIVKNQSKLLRNIVEVGNDLKGMSPLELKLLASSQLSCLNAALLCKDPATVGITEFDYDLETLEDLMDSSKFAEETIDSIEDILTFLQAPGQPPTQIKASGNSTVMWVVTNDEEHNLTNYLSKQTDIPVQITDKFVRELRKTSKQDQHDLTMRMCTLGENIYWWSKSDVKSNLVSVTLAKQQENKDLKSIKRVENAVDMKIELSSDLNSTLVNGSTMEYDWTTKCTLDKDLAIKVHRIDPIPQGLISLRFIYPPTNGSLLVHVEEGYRPDCETMKQSKLITEESPNYPHRVSLQEEATYFYVGIISNTNQTVNYTFEVNTTVCQFWATGHWSTQGCKISSHKTKDLEVHCACDHFSIFAAAFPVPPQEIDLFSDIKLFSTVLDNPLVVSFVAVLLLIYLLCCFWAWRKDKHDRNLRNITVLEDNFPGDPYPYLLAIFTSSRFNAGTTAHVGLRIKGSLESSRSHILSRRDRSILKRNRDDWFLIFSPVPLGDLQSVHIWHDNAGSSPDWFCDKIIVYDLVSNTEVVFVVEQWLALRLDYYPEAVVKGASVSEVNNVKRLFLNNCILGLREGHTLLCILLRHPRSEISRLQRISVLMCCILTSMLCSIMFFSSQADAHQYSVGLREFYISVQSLVISLFFTCLVLFSFKRVYKIKRVETKSSSRNTEEEHIIAQEINRPKSVYSNFVRFVSKNLKGHPLVPAQLEISEPIVVVRKTWFVVAWTLCIAVILVCSFLIMLYGLKIGLANSEKWLSAVLFTLSEDFFITAPVKIIFYSMILSIVFQNVCEVDNHRIKLEDALEVNKIYNEAKIQQLLIKRNHPMYAPIRSDVRKEMLRIKELWNNWWTVIDFTVALIFTFVVSIVVYDLWSSHYYNNHRVYNIMTESHHPKLSSVGFYGIKNMAQVNQYLESSFFIALYNTFWYNHKPIKEKGIERDYWAEDYTHSIVGYQKYRQVRVYPIKCKSAFINSTEKCIPDINRCCEETDDYGLGWKPAQWHDIEKTNFPWKYKSRSTNPLFTMYRLCGASGTVYHDGGYSAYLGPTRTKADSVVYDMISNDWQDQLTSAVFVEFTLFNINLNLFSQVTMIVEYSITGNIQLKTQVVSVESKMKLGFWNGLFVLFVFYYIIRSGYLINRQGFMEYLSSSRNRSRLLVVFFGVLSISLAAVHYVSSSAYYSSFIKSGYEDTHFLFDKFIFYFLLLQAVLSALMCLAIFRTILIFRGGRTLLNYFYTFTTSLHWVVWLSVIVGVYLFLQILLILLLQIFSFHNVQEIVLNQRFSNYLKSHSLELNYIRVYFYVKSLVVNVSMGLYIVLFMYYYKLARTYNIKRSDKFNILTVYLSLFKLFKRKKNK